MAATPLTVISGGGSGLGRDLARSLARDGHDVLIAGRRHESLLDTVRIARDEDSTPAERFVTVSVDLARPESADAILAAIDGRAVRGIVAAAGGQGGRYRTGSGASAAHDAWAEALQRNVFTAVHLVESLIPSIEPHSGRVILISSVAALDGQGGPYATAKSALHGYARDLARRLGRRGVTANVVAPGAVDHTEFFGDHTPIAALPADAVAAQSLLGRVGVPGDITACLRWLLSEGGGWTTGQVISPNGGTHLVR